MTTDSSEYPNCHGRVFRRKQLFLSLPTAMQETIQDCEAYLRQHSNELFSITSSILSARSYYGCKVQHLLYMTQGWLEHVYPDTNTTDLQSALLAQEIVDGLLLNGFVTPFCIEHPSVAMARVHSELLFPELSIDETVIKLQRPSNPRDCMQNEGQVETAIEIPRPTKLTFVSEKDVLLATEHDAIGQKSVWNVVSGAVFANIVQRKRNKCCLFSQCKELYVIVNEKSHAMYFFESDLARKALETLVLSESVHVQLDASLFAAGLNIYKDQTCVQVLNCVSEDRQRALFQALVRAGASERKAIVKASNSATNSAFYALEDYALTSHALVSMETYRSQVLLIVNIAIHSPDAYKNMEELVFLHEKYHKDGFQILAFPCNQFADPTLSDAAEIAAFAASFHANFPIFVPGNVNGKNARALFSYLKASIADPFGDFIKWDFTKFVVDRNGNVVKRLSPKESVRGSENLLDALVYGEGLTADDKDKDTIEAQ